MKRIMLIAASLAALLAIVPAGAQALTTKWELKPTGAAQPYKVLPVSTPVTLKTIDEKPIGVIGRNNGRLQNYLRTGRRRDDRKRTDVWRR